MIWKDMLTQKVRQNINDLDKKIKEEKQNLEADRHKILRMEEQKLITGMFDPQMWGGMGSKFQLPW